MPVHLPHTASDPLVAASKGMFQSKVWISSKRESLIRSNTDFDGAGAWQITLAVIKNKLARASRLPLKFLVIFVGALDLDFSNLTL